MKKIILLAGAAALCMGAPALANKEHMEQKAKYYFNQMDSNGDGKITKAEHSAFGVKMFDEADMDNNDELSMTEVKTQKMEMKKEYKAKMGKDMKAKDHDDDDDDVM